MWQALWKPAFTTMFNMSQWAISTLFLAILYFVFKLYKANKLQIGHQVHNLSMDIST